MTFARYGVYTYFTRLTEGTVRHTPRDDFALMLKTHSNAHSDKRPDGTEATRANRAQDIDRALRAARHLPYAVRTQPADFAPCERVDP